MPAESVDSSIVFAFAAGGAFGFVWTAIRGLRAAQTVMAFLVLGGPFLLIFPMIVVAGFIGVDGEPMLSWFFLFFMGVIGFGVGSLGGWLARFFYAFRKRVFSHDARAEKP